MVNTDSCFPCFSFLHWDQPLKVKFRNGTEQVSLKGWACRTTHKLETTRAFRIRGYKKYDRILNTYVLYQIQKNVTSKTRMFSNT